MDLLERYGLAYRPSGQSSFHYIPTRCEEEAPVDLFLQRFPLSAVPAKARLYGLRFELPGAFSRLPDGFAESVIVALHSLLISNLQVPGQATLGPPGVASQWKRGTLFQGVLYPRSSGGASEEPSGLLQLLILVHAPTQISSNLELLWMLLGEPEAGGGPFEPSGDLVRMLRRLFESFCRDSVVPIAERFSPFTQPVLEILEQDPEYAGQGASHHDGTYLESGETGSSRFLYSPAYLWRAYSKLEDREMVLPAECPGVSTACSRYCC